MISRRVGVNENKGFSVNGFTMVVALLLAQIGTLVYFDSVAHKALWHLLPALIVGVCWAGFFMVQPNQGKVLTFFGSYVGTVKANGLRWTVPLFMRKTLSLRIRNFESAQMKVNDNQGNPIEIAAIIVWSVTDTAEAVFEVDNFESYVVIQSESAIRNMASSFPYDPRDDEEAEVALRSHPQRISDHLQSEIQARLNKAGITVHEARLSHLAYAPEIASAMLQRQQASAIIAARRKIVDGAVGMVEMALSGLSEKEVVELDDERRANMVSNLLVVLCGDKAAQPVVNSGSLY